MRLPARFWPVLCVLLLGALRAPAQMAYTVPKSASKVSLVLSFNGRTSTVTSVDGALVRFGDKTRTYGIVPLLNASEPTVELQFFDIVLLGKGKETISLKEKHTARLGESVSPNSSTALVEFKSIERAPASARVPAVLP
jgi:hypothetical protein